MCQELEDAKEQEGQGPLSSKSVMATLRNDAMRSLEELNKDFHQRLSGVEAEAVSESPVPKLTEQLVKKPSRAERRPRAAASRPALPSLEDLEREFLRRRAARQQAAAPAAAAVPPAEEAAPKVLQTGTLKKLVEGKGFGFIVPDEGSKDVFLHFSDLVTGSSQDMVLGMRVSFFGEVDAKSGKTRARNASIVDDNARETTDSTVRGGAATRASAKQQQQQERSTRDAAGVVKPDKAIVKNAEELRRTQLYDRTVLLSVRGWLAHEGEASLTGSFPIRTVPMPRCEVAGQRRGGRFAEDPRLDDEDLIVEMEDRLSRESGADAKNVETFGDCLGGWTFEQALEANSQLPHRTFARAGCALSPLLTFGAVEERRRLETPPLVMHAVRRSMYRAVALQLVKAPKESENCLSPVPSSCSLEHCPSTAASSGSETPFGPAEFAKESKEELWGPATMCYQ